jgi:hypothetical protein
MHFSAVPIRCNHFNLLLDERHCRLQGVSTIYTLAGSLNMSGTCIFSFFWRIRECLWLCRASTTTSSAIMMLQRFYMLQSFKQFEAKVCV